MREPMHIEFDLLVHALALAVIEKLPDAGTGKKVGSNPVEKSIHNAVWMPDARTAIVHTIRLITQSLEKGRMYTEEEFRAASIPALTSEGLSEYSCGQDPIEGAGLSDLIGIVIDILFSSQILEQGVIVPRREKRMGVRVENKQLQVNELSSAAS